MKWGVQILNGGLGTTGSPAGDGPDQSLVCPVTGEDETAIFSLLR